MEMQRQKILMTGKSGFSLVEVLLALALVAIIAGITIANLGGMFGSGQVQAAEVFVHDIDTPLTTYRIHMGRYPTTAEGLKALLEAPEGKSQRWKGPYIKSLPLDPWQRPYQYRSPGIKNTVAGYDVWSLGPNGIEDDKNIGNWK